MEWILVLLGLALALFLFNRGGFVRPVQKPPVKPEGLQERKHRGIEKLKEMQERHEARHPEGEKRGDEVREKLRKGKGKR